MAKIENFIRLFPTTATHCIYLKGKFPTQLHPKEGATSNYGANRRLQFLSYANYYASSGLYAILISNLMTMIMQPHLSCNLPENDVTTCKCTDY